MKLLLRRDQRSGMLGKVTFTLDVRADISAEEKSRIEKYKLGNEMLYVKNEMKEVEAGMKGLGKALMHHALNVTVSVKDLMQGKRIECKDIMEMLDAEEQIKESALTFAKVLQAAAHFGGEEAIELSAA